MIPTKTEKKKKQVLGAKGKPRKAHKYMKEESKI